MLLALMRILVAAGQIVVWSLQLLIFLTGCILQATTALQAIMPRLGFQTKHFKVSFFINIYVQGWLACYQDRDPELGDLVGGGPLNLLH
jgi:hypothetical protein